MQDIVVVGAGLGGSLAATMLHQRGFRIVLIDRYQSYPSEFRAEQIVGSQIQFFNSIGISPTSISGAHVVPQAWNFSLGKQLPSVLTPHCGMPYQSIVQALRDNIPEGVRRITGRVSDVESGQISTVHLEDGQTIRAKLVVMATGLNTKLGRRLGIDYQSVGVMQSTTVGFDIRSPKCDPATAAVLVYHGANSPLDIDYLTIFRCRDVLRGNLFLYCDPHEPWLGQLRRAPRQTLLQAFPSLVDELGEFTVEHVQCRTSEIVVAQRHARDGMILIGDAYQTPCPAAGTGIARLLVDVERLTAHTARWFAANDTSVAALQSYYNDPMKRRSDRAAIREARFRRAITMDASWYWAMRRQNVKAKRFVKYVLQSTRDLLMRTAQAALAKARQHRAVCDAWLSGGRDTHATKTDPVGAAPGEARGAH